MDVFETPVYKDEDGNIRPPDEFQPRTNIRRQFENGSLSLNNQESIGKFCQEYIVDERHTRAYLEHLLYLKRVSEIRKRDREVQKEVQKGKKYSDYNWDKLATSVNSLLKLKVSELDKFLEYHKLSKNGRKGDKTLQILAHKLQDDLPERLSVATEVNTGQESSDSDGFSEGEDQNSDSDSDVILAAFGESEEEEVRFLALQQKDFVTHIRQEQEEESHLDKIVLEMNGSYKFVAMFILRLLSF